MLDGKQIMLETLSTAGCYLALQQLYNGHDKPYFLRIELAKHSFNYLMYVIIWA